MRPGHSNEACRRGTCQKCNEKHHTLLHKFPSTENLTSANISSVVLTASTNKSERSEYVMLSTAYVQTLDVRNNTLVVRVLLDAGSQSNYITQELCEKLSLNTSEQEMIIAGLNNSVSKDFYVDDCLTGSDQLENAALIIRGVADILKQGRFVLRKFYSNNPEVLKYVSDENTPANLVEFGENENAKTLGLSWCPTSDKLLYKINIAPAKQKEKKHPILLCSKHHLTVLIFRDEHIRLLHAGPQQVLASLRERLSRLQHIQQCQQHFWRRWKQEYIADLQRRTKWTTTKGQLHVGDVVLLKEDNSPPLSWKLGRVIQLHPGVDGVSRVATVKTSRSDVKRSYAKLCPLPKEDVANE
ncbi:hypothetical protein NQ317_012711 [Molorchus minor]|uniref:DUF5641 domain-containing protein n=1 Tax=Molorchus minor TaxID=1323400 RepID=A0ABQ9JGH0_9CUCU|nr:hypothetical protein NQ317_012711 [Molorchus minor]